MPMPEISRARALAFAIALLILLGLGGRLLLASGPADGAGSASSAPAALTREAEPPGQLVVHVVGAVLEPGLYRLAEGSRVDDAIKRAGGATPRAALELVNLAAPVADGQQVVVPLHRRTAATAGAAPGEGSASGTVPAGGPVHLNSATLEELDALPGVGPVTAQQILDYRTAKGAFSSIEELDAVPGIGPARLEQLRPLVSL
jgi:competence protein ComEA